MGRAPCCDKATVKRGPWSPEEDARLRSYIEQHGGAGNWIALPHKIGLKRCGKSCRLRWLNYLRPDIRHGGFSEEEDRIICGLYATIGSRWSIIAAQLPGRTDNDIKNYWNTRLKKKLFGNHPPRKHGHHPITKQHHQHTSNAMLQLPVSNQTTYTTLPSITDLHAGVGIDMSTTTTVTAVAGHGGGFTESFSATVSGEYRTELDEIFRFGTGSESTVTSASASSETVNWWYQQDVQQQYQYLGTSHIYV